MSNAFKEGLKVDLNPLQRLTDTEKVDVFRKYIDSQKSHFENYINFMNSELCALKSFRIISNYTKFLARIKSVESSIKNDNSKALNDVFGIEVDSATPGESAFVVMFFKDTLTETKEAVHNKENGYRAHHYSGYPKAGKSAERLEEILNTKYDATEMFNEYIEKLPDWVKNELTQENLNRLEEYYKKFCNDLNNYIEKIKESVKGDKLKILKRNLKKIEQEYHKIEKIKNTEDISEFQPIIEGQFKTIQVAIEANVGTASHGDYKGEDLRKIQKEYDKNGGLPLSRLPIMYESELKKDENGKPIPLRILSSDEAAAHLYPSLIINQEEMGEKGEIS